MLQVEADGDSNSLRDPGTSVHEDSRAQPAQSIEPAQDEADPQTTIMPPTPQADEEDFPLTVLRREDLRADVVAPAGSDVEVVNVLFDLFMRDEITRKEVEAMDQGSSLLQVFD